MKDGVEKRIRFAFGPEVEKEFQIIFDVLNDLGQVVDDLNDIINTAKLDFKDLVTSRNCLGLKLDGVSALSFWARVRFLFSRSLPNE